MGESGILDKLKGRVKEAAGAIVDNDDLKRSGRTDQIAGDLKDKADEIVDRVRDALDGDSEDRD